MDTILKLIISKGHYSAKKSWQELRFLFSTHCLMLLYICTKFHENENILDGIKVIQQTKFSSEKKLKEHKFTKNVGGVTILVLCTLSVTSLFFYQVS